MYAGTGESFYNVDTINGNGILKIDRPRPDLDAPARRPSTTRRSTTSRASSSTRQRERRPGRDHGRAATRRRCCQRSSIFKSIDGGATWTEVHAVTDLGSFGRVKKIQQTRRRPRQLQHAVRDRRRGRHPEVDQRRRHLDLRQHRHHRLQRPLRTGHLAGQHQPPLRLGRGREPLRAVDLHQRRHDLVRDLRDRRPSRTGWARRAGTTTPSSATPPMRTSSTSAASGCGRSRSRAPTAPPPSSPPARCTSTSTAWWCSRTAPAPGAC